MPLIWPFPFSDDAFSLQMQFVQLKRMVLCALHWKQPSERTHCHAVIEANTEHTTRFQREYDAAVKDLVRLVDIPPVPLLTAASSSMAAGHTSSAQVYNGSHTFA